MRPVSSDCEMRLDMGHFRSFCIGDYIATTMLAGVLNPDMQLCNMGLRANGQPAFIDFANVARIKIPDELDKNDIRRFTESLFPLLDDLETFSTISYFRAGLISRGGYFCRTLFSNTSNHGFSSLAVLLNGDIETSYNPSELCNSEVMREWITVDVEDIKPTKFRTLESYGKTSIRQNLLPANRYYLDFLYFTRTYVAMRITQTDCVQIVILMLNMAYLSLSFGSTLTAYGLFRKCLTLTPEMTEIVKLCKDGINKVKRMTEIENSTIEFIESCLHHGFIELLWILDDLDNITAPKGALRHKTR